jgi:LPS sulfotransferase NodH
MENSKRLDSHKKNTELEFILKTLEANIVDLSKTRQFETNQPKLFILGCARSGTTLLSQLLAQHTDWCYPTNFISRFYYSPYMGALIQKMLIELDDKGELFGKQESDTINLNSTLGKTTGALSPHEFWYFWRRFFKFNDIQQLTAKELNAVDNKLFENSLNALQTVYEKPLFMKAMIMNWNIKFLAENIPNSYFLFIKRETVYNAQSLLKARQNYFGNTNEWYSFKPPEYHLILREIPEKQVLEQVMYTNQAIENQLKSLNQSKYISIQYEDLCANPTLVFSKIYSLIDSKFTKKIEPIKSTNFRQIEEESWNKLNRL